MNRPLRSLRLDGARITSHRSPILGPGNEDHTELIGGGRLADGTDRTMLDVNGGRSASSGRWHLQPKQIVDLLNFETNEDEGS